MSDVSGWCRLILMKGGCSLGGEAIGGARRTARVGGVGVGGRVGGELAGTRGGLGKWQKVVPVRVVEVRGAGGLG